MVFNQCFRNCYTPFISLIFLLMELLEMNMQLIMHWILENFNFENIQELVLWIIVTFVDIAVRYNGQVSGYSIVLNHDNSWSNETAGAIDLHGYVVTSEGRAFTVLNGNLSPALARSLQPMTIFGTTLGWLFSKTTQPAINGVQYSGQYVYLVFILLGWIVLSPRPFLEGK